MTQTLPHPEFWHPIAELIAALRALLRGTPLEAFAQIALDARAQLAVVTAMVRRYIHVLAAEVCLPPAPARPPLPDVPAGRAGRSSTRRYLFPLVECPAGASRPSQGEDPPGLQLAFLMQAAQRLADVMANPASHALRLARRLRRAVDASLRELPVPWHIIRRIHPATDALLTRLDAAARPQAWAGMDTS